MSSLELKVPPPLVALIAGLLMWLVSLLATPIRISFRFRVGAALAVACIGLAIGISAMAAFRRAKTTMNPMKPDTTSSLVTSGVFGFTRNPMYLSLVIYLIAWAVYLSSWPALFVLPAFVLYIDRFQIAPEERTMSSLFGSEYVAYKGRVRRWL